jgi:spermidine synthase
VYFAIALSGFCALSGEVIWTRQLALLFGATVYTFSLILAVFLTGLGIGSVTGSVASKAINPRVAFGWCQLLIVAAIAWTAHELGLSLPYWPINPAISSSIVLNFKLDLGRALWAVLPPAFSATPRWAVSIANAAGKLVGGVYAASTIGAVGGALTTSLLMVA